MSKANTTATPKGDAKPAAAAASSFLVDPRFLKIAALQEGGRHRAGRFWPQDPTEVPASDFTEEQLEQLVGDKKLIVIPFLKQAEQEPSRDAETDS